MAGNHPLRPDGDAKNLNRFIRMEKHPDCQPRRAVTVNGSYDDDRDRNQDLESNWIDNEAPPDQAVNYSTA